MDITWYWAIGIVVFLFLVYVAIYKSEERDLKSDKAKYGPIDYGVFFMDNTAQRNGEWITFICAFRDGGPEGGLEDTVAVAYGATEKESRRLAKAIIRGLNGQDNIPWKRRGPLHHEDLT